MISNQHLQNQRSPKMIARSSYGLGVWFRHRTKSMSAKEVMAFMSTEEYLDVKFQSDIKNNLDLLPKLNSFAKSRTLLLWNETINRLLTEGHTQEQALPLAETELVDMFFIPPTFTQVTLCSSCGYVPTKELPFKTVASCIWCGTGFFNRQTENDL